MSTLESSNSDAGRSHPETNRRCGSNREPVTGQAWKQAYIEVTCRSNDKDDLARNLPLSARRPLDFEIKPTRKYDPIGLEVQSFRSRSELQLICPTHQVSTLRYRCWFGRGWHRSHRRLPASWPIARARSNGKRPLTRLDVAEVRLSVQRQVRMCQPITTTPQRGLGKTQARSQNERSSDAKAVQHVLGKARKPQESIWIVFSATK
jgi:hypothetical protein